MNGTETRREQIRAILSSRNLGSQEALLHALAERGVQTTQPVLSRDLRALKAAKRGGVYQLDEAERVTRLDALSSLLRSACAAGPNLVVMRTEPGAASTIARALEAESFDGMLGTVAGDDTVVIAVSQATFGAEIIARVLPLI